MSDIAPGGRVPADPAYPLDVPPQPVAPSYAVPGYENTTTYADTEPRHASDQPSKPVQVAQQARDSAGQAATDVKDTAKEQAQRVGQEAKTQARSVASEVRSKLDETAKAQNGRLVGSIRQTADQLDEMRGARADSPAAAVVSRVAEGGRQFADYLDRNGPDGVLREVEDFARRRPGAFLATALAAGFVVGRLGKSVAKADGTAGAGKPDTDTFRSEYDTPAGYGTTTTGYSTPAADTTPSAAYVDPAAGDVTVPVTPATTEYTATGTGIPAVVDETYPERRS
ncbi:hypothetical protein [Actinoplanes sp. DH11]|uniref:hypothetical protein n=1 Tax=Actinoplanes sp. DH11 TaxID=2857011 RepID=UPI001E455966|nr:hypothetical protein [Actinoplanes sp. DH11]